MDKLIDYYYILDENKNPIPIHNIKEWGEFIVSEEKDNRRVALDEFPIGNTRVSTVFLGINHAFNKSKPPILFETMIFSEEPLLDQYCERYATWNEAVEGHNRIIREGVNGINFGNQEVKKITLNLKVNKDE